jgi:hypothetical protein
MSASTIPASEEVLGQIRRLMRGADRGVLSTLSVRPTASAWPYGSLVLVAADVDGAPLMLLSDLADHTRNLTGDSRASLLLDATAGLADPLTGARATLIGRVIRVIRVERRLARFLARHPSADRYAAFGDFNLYRLQIERAHLVAGFGKIHWVDADPTLPAPAPLTENEADIIDHMNEDHGDALDLFANILLALPGTGWKMTGIDAEGLDLRLGGQTARVDFAEPIGDPEGARAALVLLTGQARGQTP